MRIRLREVVSKIYDLEADYCRMKELLAAPSKERPKLFDDLRKHYPVRRESHRTKMILPKKQRGLWQMLQGIGFFEIEEKK